MILCGLDPGLQQTGYAVLDAEPGRSRLLDAGLIKTARSLALAERLAVLAQDLADLFAEHSALEVVAVEELYSHYAHPRTAILMAHARGAILLVARQAGLRVVSLSATNVKKAVVGSGHASKEQVQKAVLSEMGLAGRKKLPLDVTDALAIAICCREHFIRDARLPARRPARR